MASAGFPDMPARGGAALLFSSLARVYGVPGLEHHSALNAAHCTFTLHTAHCTLHEACCMLHTKHITLHTAQCTMHSAHLIYDIMAGFIETIKT